MRNRLLLFLSVIAFNAALSAQTGAFDPVLNAESARFEAMIRRDTVQLRQVLSDDLVYIHSNGLVETKMEHISSISKTINVPYGFPSVKNTNANSAC